VGENRSIVPERLQWESDSVGQGDEWKVVHLSAAERMMPLSSPGTAFQVAPDVGRKDPRHQVMAKEGHERSGADLVTVASAHRLRQRRGRALWILSTEEI